MIDNIGIYAHNAILKSKILNHKSKIIWLYYIPRPIGWQIKTPAKIDGCVD